MSENKIRKAFRTTKIRIDSETVPAKEQRDKLEELFMTMEAAKTDAVSADRASGIAAAKAKTQQAKAKIAELEFLNTAAGNFAQVAGDRFWIIYRDVETIILEGFTERLFRNNLRAQQDMLGSQIANSGDEGDVDRNSLYESDDEEADNNDLQDMN